MINLKKILFLPLVVMMTLTNSSCFFSDFFIPVEPLRYKVIAQKGSASLSLCAYYDDENLTFSDDISLIESAFKSNDESNYQIIFYDSVRGLDLCEEYGNYAYVATIARGNQQYVPLKESIDNDQPLKILANNEFGSLGKSLKAMLTDQTKYSLSFVDLNELDYYNYFLSGEYLNDGYDYAFISEPYATRLMTLKASPLYNKEYDEYTLNEDRGFDTSLKMYCDSLKQFYNSFNSDYENSSFGIPQTGIFVNKDFYQSNYQTINKVFNLINNEISNKYVKDVGYTRLDFINLSTEFNDPDEDMDSELTLKAFQLQFDKVGISWNEATRLQAWHTVLGQNPNFEKYINRLEYVKDITSYYSIDYMKEYYRFIGEEFPSEDNFIKLSI